MRVKRHQSHHTYAITIYHLPSSHSYQHPLKQTPPTLPRTPIPLPQRPLFSPAHHTFLSLLKRTQPLHLLEHMLKKFLAAHDVEVAFDLWVFFGEAIYFFLCEAAA